MALDAQVAAGHGDDVALICVPETGPATRHTYADLSRETSRFAHLLRQLGVGTGDRVMSLLGRQAEQYVTALGTLKNGSVFSPLFSSFGPEPIRQRLLLGDAKVLVTTPSLYRRKVAALRAELPMLEHVLLVGAGTADATVDLEVELAGQPSSFDIPATDPEQMALLHFTSGTTGTPKGAIHVHQAVLAHHVSARYALDLHRGDVFWCTADPGWVTGTSYGMIAPLTHGATLVSFAGEYDPRVWYGILAEHRVNVWYTAPTALRMLMRSGAALAGEYDLSSCATSPASGRRSTPRWCCGARTPTGCPSTTTGGRRRPGPS
ncbi:MAG: AMP-binding protein [Nocardioides sp.]